MYNAEESKVTSKLVDSYAWDTTCRWLINSGLVQEASPGKIDSTSYGNYRNSTFTIKNGTLYAKHVYLIAKEESGEKSNWYYLKGGAGKYSYNAVENENGMQVGIKTNATVPSDIDASKYTADERIEIATGSSDNTRINNIYDLAGNMQEWTTETRIRKNNTNGNNILFAVLRGGCFSDNGSSHPVVCRGGGFTVSDTFIFIGFRTMLYIK